MQDCSYKRHVSDRLATFCSQIFERCKVTSRISLHQSCISVNSTTNMLLLSDTSVRPVRSDLEYKDDFPFYKAVWKVTTYRCVVLVEMVAVAFRLKHFINIYI